MKPDARDYLGYLRSIISDCSKSVVPLYHPLGFVSCVLPSVEEGIILRVHYWPKYDRREKAPSWPIHTHNFRLSSCVIEGEVENIEYQVVDGVRGGGLRALNVYNVRYDGEHSKIVDSGDLVHIMVASDFVHTEGMSYVVEKGEFHESVVPTGVRAITLACLTEKGSETPFVLGDISGGDFSYEREEFDPGEFWSVVAEASSEKV
ncbi:hypothetical protein [Stenotrophomonas rhizophila]|uniref:hypothetical protein n=1 Tax=Stenotrophomonas rhizophila TaxID=216778 RepID=UPI0033943FF8